MMHLRNMLYTYWTSLIKSKHCNLFELHEQKALLQLREHIESYQFLRQIFPVYSEGGPIQKHPLTINLVS